VNCCVIFREFSSLDFWERFLDSLRALSAKGQRTVYRLTLVKAWNVEELESYAELVKLGEPDFIEIKGSCHFIKKIYLHVFHRRF
jgi:wyosine [tRNA(Phe)-imidazoG37] synthetase (radical SAM superfamily)